MKVLITGSNGFLGKNLVAHLDVRHDVEVVCFTREDEIARLPVLVADVDFIFHLAGVNRPQSAEEFTVGNTNLTLALCDAIKASGNKPTLIFASSTQAALDNPYGASKREAEDALVALEAMHGINVHLFRLTNVFGKWSRPNYNSVVATFCFNIARGLPITINDPYSRVSLVYIDDVMAHFIAAMDGELLGTPYVDIQPVYNITLGELATQLTAFRDSRSTLVSEPVGTGLVRALYSTYVSYLPVELFAYEVPKYRDPRGVFVEMLKTKDSGQFSYFTAHPGITRGGHFHHSKTEKFLVIKGTASFRFRHITSGEFYELTTHGDQPSIVETVPGWTHDITNVGEEEMIVMLWANEIFDRDCPDTYAMPVVAE